MQLQKINLEEKRKEIKSPWQPIEIARANDQVIRLALMHGQYHWHKHENEDELFIVFKGKIKIQTNSGNIILNEGEGVKIPRGVDHRPIATQSSVVLMFENSKLESKGS